jgi:hypothetical protein
MAGSTTKPGEAEAPVLDSASFERACRGTAWALVILTLATVGLPLIGSLHPERLTAVLAFTQDLPLVPVFVAALLLCARWATADRLTQQFRNPALWIAGSIGLILLAGWIGHYLVFGGYALSRDEQMAVFDTAIFGSGQLLSPIPIAWRPFADALNLTFILPVGAREFWVSAYLPGHAAWRAMVGAIADPALASPLMAAFGGYCLWRISRLLWPASLAAQLTSVLLYACSSQVLVTAMTAFSMSMHVALNMLWLWLFLLDRRRTHAAAILVGWVATGIHQPLFHPLFALPFFFVIAGEKRWKLLAVYLFAYALIAAFWLAWPLWISAHGSAPAVPISGTSGIGFVERLEAVLKIPDALTLWLMVANLLRFVCWQHPLLVPLAIVGVWSSFRQQAVCRALAIGFVLPVIVMALLLPWQGYGWGYRYVHPVLGNAILLASYGCASLAARGIGVTNANVRAGALALLVIFPVHAAMAHHFVAPFVRLHREITAIDADIVIVDTGAAPYADDLVINDPHLANRPKLLLAGYVKPGEIKALCRLGSVAFVPGPPLAPLAEMFHAEPPKPGPEIQALASTAVHDGCIVKRI